MASETDQLDLQYIVCIVLDLCLLLCAVIIWNQVYIGQFHHCIREKIRFIQYNGRIH